MASNTTKLQLYKKDPVADGGDNFNVDTMLNQNWDKVEGAFGDLDAKVPGGTATALTLALANFPAYRAGFKVTIIPAAPNNSNPTTLKINALAALPVYKPGTTTAPKLVAGKAYTLIVAADALSFFLVASAEGTAVAADVLAGKTFSSDDDTGIEGTMVNRGAILITPSTVDQAIPVGYHSGLGYVAGDADLISNNIKAGANIFGVAGNANVVDTSAGDAVAAEILSGKKAYVDGALVTGTIPSKAMATITPGTTDQVIAAGQYLAGAQTIAGDADLISTNIKAGVNIFGVAGNANVVDTSAGDATAAQILSGKKAYVDGALLTGTLVSQAAVTDAVNNSASEGNIWARFPQGAYITNGGAGYPEVHLTDADFAAANIKSGVNIFGIAGAANCVSHYEVGTVSGVHGTDGSSYIPWSYTITGANDLKMVVLTSTGGSFTLTIIVDIVNGVMYGMSRNAAASGITVWSIVTPAPGTAGMNYTYNAGTKTLVISLNVWSISVSMGSMRWQAIEA